MINSSPKVTVFMPAYNAEKYIGAAVRSVLAQTYSDWELIIVNDGSTDGTETAVKGFSDARIRYVRNDVNKGLGSVRNQGISLARGRYIALLDADDIALPERIALQAAFLDAHPDFALVGSWTELIDENGRKTGDAWKSRVRAAEMREALFFWNQFTQSSVCFRKNMLPSPAYRQEFAPAEEYDLWIRLAEEHKLGTIPKVLARYRVLPKSASHGSGAQDAARKKILTANLSRIGITPTQDELALHVTNYAYRGTDVRAFLDRREAWFLELKSANGATRVFDEKQFDEMLAERWLISCSSNARLGLFAWRRFWSSPLTEHLRFRTRGRDIMKFAVKVLLKRSAMRTR